jgi:L-alanine-DL-glutamate epimerase-like enolase superfamily enzyme
MRLKQIEIFRLQIPLCMPIKHHLAERSHSDNLVVKIVTDSGVVGYGEGVARQYVTGETMESSLRFLPDCLIPEINDFKITGLGDLEKALWALASPERRAQAPAACCALELAILDAAGKSWSCSVGDMFGRINQTLIYSAVLPMMNPPSFERALNIVQDLKMAFVKIKVGNEKDLELLSLARKVLGEQVNIRVDANGAWSNEEAEKRIASMTTYGISAVEQPVPKEDILGLKRVADRASVPVVADESLCTEGDAKSLASLGACQIFNLRLSKCGGILAAVRMHEIARKKGIASQLGCQVGETGILAAAGRQLAVCRELVHLEGSYSNYLLKEDIVQEPVDFGPGGLAKPLPAFGLGINVNEEALHRLAIMHHKIRLSRGRGPSSTKSPTIIPLAASDHC